MKGEDLLFLDHPNTKLERDDRSPPTRSSGSKPAPSPTSPSTRHHGRATRPAHPTCPAGSAGVDSFYWTLAEFCADRLLPYVFADADDEKQQYTMVVHAVTAHLARVAVPADGGVVDRRHPPRAPTPIWSISSSPNSTTRTARAMWGGSSVGLGTVNAFARRLIGSKKDLARLIRGDLPQRRAHAINTADSAQVTVVDLHNLPDRAQRFVVGVTLRTEFERKEKSGTAKPLLFVVLDELNKYAPREGTSPIKEVLLDIAERGRSLGVVLIGAQQTASEVERRIVANSAVRVVGRLDAAEASRPEYGFLPPAQRARALIAKPGTMFVGQPEIPVPLVVEFPFPAWATRPAEAGAAPSATLRSITQAVDPFDVVGAAGVGRSAVGLVGASLSDDDIPF